MLFRKEMHCHIENNVIAYIIRKYAKSFLISVNHETCNSKTAKRSGTRRFFFVPQNSSLLFNHAHNRHNRAEKHARHRPDYPRSVPFAAPKAPRKVTCVYKCPINTGNGRLGAFFIFYGIVALLQKLLRAFPAYSAF